MDESSRHDRFMRLFLPVQQSLYVYLRSLLQNTSDTEDVLQNAARVMWEKFDDFQPGTRFDHWAYGICRLQAMRHLKERKRSKLILGDNLFALLADRAVAISDRTGESMVALEACVEQLTEEERRLLKMRFEPNGTNRSVARAVGRSEMSISRTFSRIYGVLLECIQRSTASQKRGERP